MSPDYSVLGLCRKAGKLLTGHDAAFEAVKNGTAALVLLTSDASPRHERELADAGYRGETLFLPGTMDDVGHYAGKRACIYAVADTGFAGLIKKKLGDA